MHTEHEQHKHILLDEMTPYQKFVHKCLMGLLELTTLELVVAVAHLALTFVAVFGIVGGGGGEGH